MPSLERNVFPLIRELSESCRKIIIIFIVFGEEEQIVTRVLKLTLGHSFSIKAQIF